MRKVETQLITCDNQFGFKREHGTDLCVFTVKSVKYYNLHNSPVYTCFLDASKAYDRVNYWTLFRKLLNRSIHILIVRKLMYIYWYTKQELCIRTGGELKCCHILLFLMEYDKEEYCLHRYLLYTWMSSLH